MKKDPIQLQQKLIYYRAELDKYKKKVKDYQDNYHYSQLEKLKVENEELQEKIEQWNHEESVLNGELTRRIQGFEERVNRYEEQEEKYKTEIKDWQNRAIGWSHKEKELSGKVQDLEGGLGETRRRLFQSQRDLSMLQRSYAEIQQKLQIVTEAKAEAEEEVKKLKEYLADTKKNFSLEIDKLENECAQLNRRLEQKEQMVLQAQQDFSFLQNNFNNERTARLNELKMKKRAQQESITIKKQLDESNQKHSKAVGIWKKNKEELEKKNEELTQRSQTFMEEIKGVKESLAKARDDYSELENTYRKEKEQFEKERLKEKQDAHKEVSKWKEECQTVKGEVKRLQKSLSANEADTKRMLTKISKLNNESEKQRKENEALKKELDAFQSPPYLEQIGEGEFFSQMEEHMRYIFGEEVSPSGNQEGKVAFMKVLEKKLEELATNLEENNKENE
ncbi:hypothetical protein [Halobacillus sp. Nhm2S1]|uniref:hypothetical protein n=1 Tax=Halobacillus sp. Nhm2S1 TaxID=2866716 RepID=UPI001C7313E4|nr:hypothetical protein [Halobacillus sp. Nhm2S1]MBX0359338.1 hypothetical protein [Halobacillus sp. Nhm2S1]